MQTKPFPHLILDRNDFREVMKEAKLLMDGAKRIKYNLMHEHSIDHYDLWSPYVLDDIPKAQVQSPGYKIAFLQVMSIVLAMKDGAIEGLPKEEKKEINSDENNIINFSSYKSNKNNNNIYKLQM